MILGLQSQPLVPTSTRYKVGDYLGIYKLNKTINIQLSPTLRRFEGEYLGIYNFLTRRTSSSQQDLIELSNEKVQITVKDYLLCSHGTLLTSKPFSPLVLFSL